MTFFIFLHQARASRRFLTILTKFDPKSTWGGPKNLNFDLAVRTGWNQCHCEDYRIFVPTTVHGLKSELDWPRYHENWDDTPIDAPQTSESHNFWFDRWIFRFHTFSELGSQDISRGTQIHTFWGPLKGCLLEILPWGYISPRHAPDQRPHFFWVLFFALFLYTFFSLFQTPKNTQKTGKNFSILPSSPKNTWYRSYTQSSFPWFYTLDLGFRGVDVAFLAVIHTLNLLNLFLAFILLFSLE